MEMLLSPMDQELIYEKFKIRINEVLSAFRLYEDLDDLLIRIIEEKRLLSDENIVSLIRYRENLFASRNDKWRSNKEAINYFFKGRISTYGFKTLSYYEKLEEKEFSSIRSGQMKYPQKYRAAINGFLCSVYNSMMELFEEVYDAETRSSFLVIFEACPNDLRQIDSRYEVLDIKNICQNAGFNNFFPIIRFGTNANVFKNTCLQYAPSALHFAGHGEGNGDLALLGATGNAKFVGPETFSAFFNGQFLLSYPNHIINMAYFNSCHSKKFADKLMHKSLIPNIRDYISYRGVNFDWEAMRFSWHFYDELTKYPSPNFFGSYSNARISFENSYPKHKAYLNNLFFN